MRKLLLVDDDEALRRLMRLELSDTFEVIDSGEPDQALALALEHRPDAILLDLHMPKYSGFELLQTFMAFSHTQKIPVVIVSGEGEGKTRLDCTELGASGYFEKPIDFEALRTCLSQITKTSKFVPRAEVRVRLRVPLQLRGADSQGNKMDQETTTENVSISGFLTTSTTELPIGFIMEVYLMSFGANYVGKAKIVHSDTKASPLWQYGWIFTDKTGPWVLK
jgi:DNA-binding response OmpR family regulator